MSVLSFVLTSLFFCPTSPVKVIGFYTEDGPKIGWNWIAKCRVLRMCVNIKNKPPERIIIHERSLHIFSLMPKRKFHVWSGAELTKTRQNPRTLPTSDLVSCSQ